MSKQTAVSTAIELHYRNPALSDKLELRQTIALVRSSRTLHRWDELECGDGNDHASWCIERDETSEKPYLVTYYHQSHEKPRRRPIPDRERGALRRIAAIAASAGLHWYHQGDCRGLALYVATEPLNDQNYSSRGVAIG